MLFDSQFSSLFRSCEFETDFLSFLQPYLYDTNRRVVITYDDPESLALKGQKAREQGIGGTIMWDIGGDSKDYTLTSAWRKGMGLSA